jgi:hypothetical protein
VYYLGFDFWQPVYFKLAEPSVPSESKEGFGHVAGISENSGHALTYKVLTSESDIIIYNSLLRPATPDDDNVRARMSGGEGLIHSDILKSRSTSTTHGEALESLPPPIFNLEDLIGRNFLMDEQEDGQKFRGRIVELLEDHESNLEDNPTRIKFRVSVNEDQAEEIITYNNMLE